MVVLQVEVTASQGETTLAAPVHGRAVPARVPISDTRFEVHARQFALPGAVVEAEPLPVRTQAM